MNCPSCRMEIVEDAVFCHYCGSKVDQTAADPTPMQRFQSAMPNDTEEDEEERELWQGSYSKLAMIGSWIGAAAFTIVLVIVGIAASFGGRGWGIVLGILLLVWGVLILRLLYLQLSRHYYLSNQRFVHEEGLLWRQINRVEAIDIDDVTFVQGPIERFLGVVEFKLLRQLRFEFVRLLRLQRLFVVLFERQLRFELLVEFRLLRLQLFEFIGLQRFVLLFELRVLGVEFFRLERLLLVLQLRVERKLALILFKLVSGR